MESGEPARESWQKHGYALLPQVVPHSLIDTINEEVARFRKTCGEAKDEFGFGQRIGLFHVKSESSMRAALSAPLRAFLAWAFQDEPLLYGSLTFEAGTEQSAHIDAIFFFTQPQHAMAGCWIALDDVHPDAGPLFYYPGTHLWPLDRGEDVLRRRPEMKAELDKLVASRARQEALNDFAARLGNEWTAMLKARLEASKLEPVTAIVRKGDVVVWHPLLVHGGLPRKNRALPRRSMVVHYIGKNALMYDMTSFFVLANGELTKKKALSLKVKKHALGLYVKHSKVVTY